MPRADRVPFVAGQRLVGVRATLNGQADFLLLVDSGAVSVVISQRTASRLALDFALPLRSATLAGVGQSPSVPVVRLDRVRVGGSKASGLEAAVYDLPAAVGVDGLLGLNFLQRFRVTFEFDTRTLVLRPPPPRRSP
jgi:clan AA aspartic protease (TIGR02281 family)